MITTVVQFKVRDTMSRDAVTEEFSNKAPSYQSIEGLMQKNYLLSEDGQIAGGSYLWRSRADAERLFTDDWKKNIAKRFGSDPSIAYFESAVIVDNVHGEIIEDS